ncbi:LuxR family transcriptional regulator [Mesorhizobium sp. ESP6-5]|uniref:helix-turn-helix transcriptional regulator n=1 Tax=unclassified Mesorhizobium TaxID=325217 RepID=UPI00112AB698|nr:MULTISPECIES: LuxR family transcriptional regulator [unclassified Mesorhizobium]MBZ9683913.1 LuxR family transcriptional regulator [Mesorhizobium sp. CO1-1-2]MBZ9725358.1 LuxR family transcriptional regulator [Mesorhizobium sp. CO1-1-11]MBZ9756973.1 LuxR family transcriptional regulator [Mesorhizobium sp. ESP6-5]TPK23974.1 LuxR family transcriptional regulator [Mesorhizobium sp. B2-5-9]TPK23997.1 LuxR family transcriptional regulator [Mesorhizobium sp. B2-5-9]
MTRKASSSRSEIASGSWRRRLSETCVTIDEIRKCSSPKGICSLLLGYVGRFGATNLLAGVIPPPFVSGREQLAHVVLAAWPEEWTARYFSNGYLARDPTIQLVRQASAPFHWSEVGDLCKVCPSGRRIMDEAKEFGLDQGLTIAFSTLERNPVGFSIAGEKLDSDPCDRLALQFVMAYAFGCASALVGGELCRKSVHLSPRQRDVLRWASEGLTVDEIAQRLNISSNTADSHLRSVRERLSVSSTIHAVAEALRLGLIS